MKDSTNNPVQQGLILDVNALSPRTLNRLRQQLESRTADVLSDCLDLQRTVVISNQALSAAFNIGMTAERAAQMLPQEEGHFRNIVEAANHCILEIVYETSRRRR